MRRLAAAFSILCLAGAALAVAANAGPSTESVAAALERLDAAVGEAIVAADWEALERLYADDFVFVAPDGRVVPRGDRMAAFRSGALRYLATEHSERSTIPGEGLAVVTGRAHTRFVARGRESEGTYRYVSVWRKSGEGWRLAYSQATKVEPPAAEETTPKPSR